MSQYQRLISYLYRYESGVKKENTGYARIELRGEFCRITVQLQENMQNTSLQKLPEAFLFIQKDWGMERIAAGQMRGNGNGYRCRIETRADNIMDSGKSFSDLDGLVLYLNDDLFYATTWKDIVVSLGQEEVELEVAQMEEKRCEAEGNADVEIQNEKNPESISSRQKEEVSPEMREEISSKLAKEILPEMREDILPEATREILPELREDILPEARWENVTEPQKEILSESRKENCQQCDCQYCPQKGRDVDFGSRILSVFPRMYPFQVENMGECVRLELKDMGYLPVKHWSLAGNPFLLHGYYCYRHIVFTRLGNKGCHIGVPGIYSKENQKKAEEYGFRQFQTLTEVKDIHGAFGYWLYPLED